MCLALHVHTHIMCWFFCSELEETPFCRRAFLVMDVDKRAGGANNLDFGEFLAGIYNYCSMSNQVCDKPWDIHTHCTHCTYTLHTHCTLHIHIANQLDLSLYRSNYKNLHSTCMTRMAVEKLAWMRSVEYSYSNRKNKTFSIKNGHCLLGSTTHKNDLWKS